MPDGNDGPSTTLYRILAEAAPVSGTVGETLITRQKETVDNDVEAFATEGVLTGDG